jgi:DNA-binding response OmpR family regulator
MSKRILLLEDDKTLALTLQELLEDEGYHITLVFDGEQAAIMSYEEKFDLYIFDINVPEIDGLSLLEALREADDNTPTIFITSMNASSDVLEGFELGANDYLKKPFEMIELKARIDNIKRHFKIDDERILAINNEISYDFERQIVIFKSKEVQLSKKEGEFLAYFLHHRGKVLSADELMVNVWSYDTAPSSATLRTYIKNIRRVLGEEVITTIRGVGYLFN